MFVIKASTINLFSIATMSHHVEGSTVPGSYNELGLSVRNQVKAKA